MKAESRQIPQKLAARLNFAYCLTISITVTWRKHYIMKTVHGTGPNDLEGYSYVWCILQRSKYNCYRVHQGAHHHWNERIAPHFGCTQQSTGFIFSLRDFGHLSHNSIKTSRNSIHLPTFSDAWPNWLHLFRSFKKNLVHDQ